MTTLFEFNSSMIDDISGAFLDGFLDEQMDYIEAQVHEALQREAPGQRYNVSWEDDEIVVSLDEAQAESEYGTAQVQMTGAVRKALLSVTERVRNGMTIRA